MMQKFLVASALFLIALTSISYSQPKLTVVGGLSFDFGKIYTSQPVKKTIVLKNEGTDTLIVSEISATCGCTGALASNDHIAPHDTGALLVTFDPSRFSGKIEKGISFETNDTSQKMVHMSFTSNITKIVSVTPDYIIYNHVRIDSSVSQEITLENEGDTKLHILSITTGSDVLLVKASEHTLKAGEESKLTCTVYSKKPGIYKGTIEIKTDHPNIPSVFIRYIANVSGKPTADASKHN